MSVRVLDDRELAAIVAAEPRMMAAVLQLAECNREEFRKNYQGRHAHQLVPTSAAAIAAEAALVKVPSYADALESIHWLEYNCDGRESIVSVIATMRQIIAIRAPGVQRTHATASEITAARVATVSDGPLGWWKS